VLIAIAPFTCAAHVLDAQASAAPVLVWSFDPWVITALVASLVLYVAGFLRLRGRSGRASRAQRVRQLLAFLGGWLALVIALVSPLDTLGAALFSAHMVQHEMLMIVAAPLLVLGRPFGAWIWAFPATWRRGIGHGVHLRWVRMIWRCATAPVSAWLSHALALWAWHAPRFFEAALHHPSIHTLQHTSFLASALLFWWSILGPHNRSASGAVAMLSLFTTMAHTGALGALLTLAPGVWYPSYFQTSTSLGFDPLEDQWLGGLIMWVPGGLAYLIAALAMAARWLIGHATPESGATRSALP
jgi:putative membrane protein